MANRLRYAARSDVGLRRPGNEDSGFADTHLLLVADGMGGHAAGELASALAVATFAEIAEEDLVEEDVLPTLAAGVDTLSERIGDLIAADPSNQGMGTTVTAMYWNEDRVGIVHVGDSRAYRLRDGHLDQITKDHTFVQTLVDSGEITPEMATTHPRRNLLIRAVDGIHTVSADVSMRETRPGDRYLLCSDGLTGVVSDPELADVLIRDADPTGAVTRLVDMALEGGAPDNVTVVVADVQDEFHKAESVVPVVVGAAGEPANRAKLPDFSWPVDEQLDPDDPKPWSHPTATETEPETTPKEPIAIVEPQRARQPKWLKALVGVLAGIVVLFAVIGAALLWWLQGQWYVADHEGKVAIFHGVPGDLGPIPLQSVESLTPTSVTDLPSYDQSRVESGIPARSMADATTIAEDLNQTAENCKLDPSTPGCPQSPDTSDPDSASTPPPNPNQVAP